MYYQFFPSYEQDFSFLGNLVHYLDSYAEPMSVSFSTDHQNAETCLWNWQTAMKAQIQYIRHNWHRFLVVVISCSF